MNERKHIFSYPPRTKSIMKGHASPGEVKMSFHNVNFSFKHKEKPADSSVSLPLSEGEVPAIIKKNLIKVLEDSMAGDGIKVKRGELVGGSNKTRNGIDVIDISNHDSLSQKLHPSKEYDVMNESKPSIVMSTDPPPHQAEHTSLPTLQEDHVTSPAVQKDHVISQEDHVTFQEGYHDTVPWAANHYHLIIPQTDNSTTASQEEDSEGREKVVGEGVLLASQEEDSEKREEVVGRDVLMEGVADGGQLDIRIPTGVIVETVDTDNDEHKVSIDTEDDTEFNFTSFSPSSSIDY